MSPSERAKTVAQWPEWARQEYEERAAIMEYCGGQPRAFAEMQAFRLTRKRLEKPGRADGL